MRRRINREHKKIHERELVKHLVDAELKRQGDAPAFSPIGHMVWAIFRNTDLDKAAKEHFDYKLGLIQKIKDNMDLGKRRAEEKLKSWALIPNQAFVIHYVDNEDGKEKASVPFHGGAFARIMERVVDTKCRLIYVEWLTPEQFDRVYPEPQYGPLPAERFPSYSFVEYPND